jgi:hypothetical protein
VKLKLPRLVIFSIVIGILLRLIFALTTYHGDLAALVLAGDSLAVKHQFINFYESVFTIGTQGELKLPDHQMTFIYQPLAYFIPGLIYLPFAGLLKGLVDGLLHTNPYLLAGKSLFFPLLIYKLPLILADLGILFLLPKFFTKKKDQHLSLILWSLNPLAIYVSSMIGQVDAILTFFLVAGLLAFKKDRLYLSVFFFTLSALVKPIGLVLLPVVALYHYSLHRRLLDVIKLVSSGLLTYLLVIAPFLPSQVYRQYTLFAEHINKTLFAGIAISPGTLIPWFFIAYATILVLLLNRRISPFYALGAALLASLSFTHFHPQWLVWLTPWLVIYLVTIKDWLTPMVTLFSWLVILFSFEPSLTYHLFFGLNLNPIALSSSLASFTPHLISLSRAWIAALLLHFTLQKPAHET